MYKRILVAVDGSPACVPALRHAIALAREQGAHLRIVHVIAEAAAFAVDTPLDFQRVDVLWRAQGRGILNDAAAAAEAGGITAESALLQEEAPSEADVIVYEARAWGADLLVLGTHGRRGIRRVLLGSVAEGVARQASIPVLLIRADAVANPSESTAEAQTTGQRADIDVV